MKKSDWRDPDHAFAKIVQAVKDGVIDDNLIYSEKVNDFVEIEINVRVKDRRMAPCMGLLNDWRDDLNR